MQTEHTKKKISNAIGIKVIDVTREQVTMYCLKKKAAACLGVSDSTRGARGKLLLDKYLILQDLIKKESPFIGKKG